MKYRKYKPYIRRLSHKDKSESMFTATRMAFYHVTGKQGYALVQHGVKGIVIEVDDSRRSLIDRLTGREKFSNWQRRVKSFGKLQF